MIISYHHYTAYSRSFFNDISSGLSAYSTIKNSINPKP